MMKHFGLGGHIITEFFETSAGPSRSGVIERATAVMDTFVDGPEWMGLDDISALSDVPRSTTFRILRQLVQLQWLHHDQRGYCLGARVRRYGIRATSHENLRSAANAALTELQLASGGVAHLGVLDGPLVNYLDKIGGAASASIPSRVGVRLPATETVCGRVLLAALRPEHADAVIGESPRPVERSTGGYDTQRIQRELLQVRRRKGIAYLPADRCDLGITAIAAPIHDATGPVAAISVSIRRDVEFRWLAPLVVRAARRTTQMLSTQHRVAV